MGRLVVVLDRGLGMLGGAYRLLNQERTQIEPSEFTELVSTNIPAEIADEFAEAIKT